NLVKGTIGQTVDAETLGGAWTHNAISGVAHYRLPDDQSCIARIRELIGGLRYTPPALHGAEGQGTEETEAEQTTSSTAPHSAQEPADAAAPPAPDPEALYRILPSDHRQPYEMRDVITAIVDVGTFDEFQADHAPEL